MVSLSSVFSVAVCRFAGHDACRVCGGVDGGLSAACFNHENPNFQPTSIATLAGGQLAPMQPPNDGFFEPVTFLGAVPPPPADDWTRGWTSYPQR